MVFLYPKTDGEVEVFPSLSSMILLLTVHTSNLTVHTSNLLQSNMFLNSYVTFIIFRDNNVIYRVTVYICKDALCFSVFSSS